MRKYLAEEARGAQPAVCLGQDVWRQGAPSAAQQQHKPVLWERCRVDVRDERGANARKAHNELEVAQRGVLLIVEAHVGLVEYHLRSLRTAVWAPECEATYRPRTTIRVCQAHLDDGIVHDPLDRGRVAEVGLFGHI